MIGRSREADIILTDASIAPRHAELVISDDHDHYLTDCASGGGSWIKSADGWRPLRQDFVTEQATLRFGSHETSLSQLLAALRPRQRRQSSTGGSDTANNDATRLTGTVERDPATGEIVRKRP